MHEQDHLSELTILKGIAETLNEGTDLTLVLNDVLAKLLEVTGFETGWLFLFDEKDEVRMITSRNLPPALLNETEQPMCGNDCWCVKQYEDGRLQKATNIIECKRLEEAIKHKWGETRGLTHHATVPLRSGNERFGILNVASAGKGRFQGEELALLEAIAFQIGNTIKRIRLTEQAKEIALLEERNRLAQDLHDSVSQLLYSIILMAKTGTVAGDKEKNSEIFKNIQSITRHAQAEMKALIWQLRPKGLEKGIISALAGYSEMLGLHMASTANGVVVLPAQIEETLWRIGQEAINNCHKHSGMREISFDFTFKPNLVEMVIEDRGCGFSYDAQVDLPSMGLRNMKDRAEALNGQFRLLTSQGKGTVISVSIPF
ncbi:GAF domain-containing sensor histidine kinase [Bacillus sp. V59.32b]|uniref:GAF domain-containing sensor histidine kinase n=1 Tax=Bacillus sp. V59.32b TaxID=1758642 RepID=UPI000E3D6F0C|nr:GAF domain-containing sensor histidine kinase [Bacillus sp. V59.32b]RFU66889.1 GAF domain-containing protein [Bacillus sp. V59.32b]